MMADEKDTQPALQEGLRVESVKMKLGKTDVEVGEKSVTFVVHSEDLVRRLKEGLANNLVGNLVEEALNSLIRQLLAPRRKLPGGHEPEG